MFKWKHEGLVKALRIFVINKSVESVSFPFYSDFSEVDSPIGEFMLHVYNNNKTYELEYT